jgi:hypothetical protein
VDPAYLDLGAVGEREHTQGHRRHLRAVTVTWREAHDPGPERCPVRIHQLNDRAGAHAEPTRGIGAQPD